MPISCSIGLSNPDGVFYAGQEVSGTVRIENDIEKTITGISITVVGQAIVSWPEFGDNKYRAEELYLKSCTYVVGSKGGPSLTYKPGIYDYQFKSFLPSALPTSFNYECGGIFYYVNIIIKHQHDNNDITFKKLFRVIHIIDLNIDPKYREPQIINKSKQFCCWCCSSGSVDVKFTLPAIGFVPGQSINFKILVDNKSNRDINNVAAYILQEVRFKSTSPDKNFKYITEKIEIKNIGQILKSTKKEFCDSLIVPETPPSTINSPCQCIRIEYYFFVVAVTGCCSTNLELFTKIFIGTVPIDNNPTATDMPITTQPTMTDTEMTSLLQAMLENYMAQSYNTFD